jgi:hypothetical protein
VLAFVLPLLLVCAAEARNLECIGGDCHGPGYAVYRSSEPGPLEWKAVCGAWKTDFFVLDDDSWQKRDRAYKRQCPNGTVVYAKSQSVATNLDTDFLAFFDRVIVRARSEGRKVLIHCRLGTHRTGRLAAYYGLKFEGWTLARALEDFEEHVALVARLFAFTKNEHVRCQIRGIAAFVQDLSAPQPPEAADCIVVTSPAALRNPALVEAENRLRSE